MNGLKLNEDFETDMNIFYLINQTGWKVNLFQEKDKFSHFMNMICNKISMKKLIFFWGLKDFVQMEPLLIQNQRKK
jgi:hypothetical protein